MNFSSCLRFIKHLFDKERREALFKNSMYYNTGRSILIDQLGDENCDDIIYRISFGEGYEEATGFFALFIYVLEYFQFADRFDMKPYVFWGSGTLYCEKNRGNEENAFDYYFKQPYQLTYQSVANSCYVKKALPGEKSFMAKHPEERYSYLISDSTLKELAAIYKKYICLNEKTEKYIMDAVDSLLGNKKTLAVHYRGTDFKQCFDNHPVPVTLEEYLSVTAENMERYGFEQIFLATDDSEALKLFVDKFGDKVRFYDDVKRSDGDVGIHCDHKSMSGGDYYRLGLEVVRDAYTLVACSGIIAGLSRVSTAARIVKRALDQMYEIEYIMDRGINSNDKKFR